METPSVVVDRNRSCPISLSENSLSAMSSRLEATGLLRSAMCVRNISDGLNSLVYIEQKKQEKHNTFIIKKRKIVN